MNEIRFKTSNYLNVKRKTMSNRSNKAKIEIADLIDQSVSNAVARRQQVMESEEFEVDLSDENQIKGGFQSQRFTKIIIGVIYPAPGGGVQ
jgi:hypothetical protein